MTEWRSALAESLEGLTHHKLRTALTLLGMIFGVAAVIAMLSIGAGAEREALKMIDMMGLRNVIARSTPPSEDKLKETRENSLGLSLADMQAALETLPFVEAHGALKKVATYSLFSERGKSDAAVFGVSPAYFELSNLQLGSGRLLHPLDDQTIAQVCVLGDTAAHALFGSEPALGKPVKINHLWLTVVGVLASQRVERAEFEGVKLSDPSNNIYLPVETALKRFKFKLLEDELDEVHLRIKPGVTTPTAAVSLSRLLETRHRGVNDFALVVPEKLLEQHRKTQRIFNMVMGSIAAISLLVGGIGIMNIMLATVLERTREIGIRRALGAKQKDIRNQFLAETLAITGIGGLIGIVVGLGIAFAITWFSGWPIAWSPWAVVIAVGVSALIGLVFGIYPAIQAARLDPIEALRREAA
jgi:putative ABC transport system permease protein